MEKGNILSFAQS